MSKAEVVTYEAKVLLWEVELPEGKFWRSCIDPETFGARTPMFDSRDPRMAQGYAIEWLAKEFIQRPR